MVSTAPLSPASAADTAPDTTVREVSASAPSGGPAVASPGAPGQTLSMLVWLALALVAMWVVPSAALVGAFVLSRALNPAEVHAPMKIALHLLVPLSGMLALLIVCAAAWFLGRAILRPLAAMSAAAHQIAAGNLEFSLPASHVREVAAVAAAFTVMGDALRAAIEREAALDQERRFFLGAIAHDLRTPLFSLRGYLEGLEQGLACTPEKAARYVAICQQKAAALERLIADLFTYVQTEHVQLSPTSGAHETVDIAAVLAQAVDSLRPQAEAKGVSIVLELSKAACLAHGDGHLLVRSVENLLDNAVRYTPAGGTIRVRCHRKDDHLTFSVADSGPGIAAHDVPHLFTPLYRGEASRNRRTGGAGLGLTIARRILQAAGGDLTAANGPAGGAVFTATLPLGRAT